MERNYLWVEKYRPSTLTECALPDRLLKTFKKIVKEGQHPHLIFHGIHGTGKTALAVALCNDMGRKQLFINGSDENGIDTFRTTIKSFATRLAVDGEEKTIIIDEGEKLNPKTVQPALRSFLERHADMCKFIFTTNNVNEIIEPLVSRCSVINFSYSPEEKKEVATKYIARLKFILNAEGIEYDDKTITKLIVSKFPDFRSVINTCQFYSKENGKIDLGILLNARTGEDYTGLVEALRKKDYKKLEDFAMRFTTEEPNGFYRSTYNALKSHIANETQVLNLISILGECQKFHSSVADKYVHILLCLAEISGAGVLDG